VSELTENVAAVPLKDTAVAPVKPLPVRFTVVPGHPDPGVTADTTGGDAGPG
jgi:hypothetical protein